MSSTNKTTNYELSQYIGSDKPTYLGDYNGDMNKIDTQMKANNTLADTAKTVADLALENAEIADGKAVSADEKAGLAQQKANTADQKASQNTIDIANLTNKVNGEVLYEDENGTTTSLVLNNKSEFKRLVFYGKNTGEQGAPTKGTMLGEFLTETKELTLNIFRARSTNLYIYTSDWEFDGDELNCLANYRSYFTPQAYIGRDTASQIAITKVIGYK